MRLIGSRYVDFNLKSSRYLRIRSINGTVERNCSILSIFVDLILSLYVVLSISRSCFGEFGLKTCPASRYNSFTSASISRSRITSFSARRVRSIMMPYWFISSRIETSGSSTSSRSCCERVGCEVREKSCPWFSCAFCRATRISFSAGTSRLRILVKPMSLR
ncbi:MAG: hypothetical protein ACD_81C00156G0001 [uncultured bacterium]|nr:MAG: hypothetical protein ACD_81C00156G0001 [uncultured bacterium]